MSSKYETPLHPKRTIPMPRNFAKEPEERYMQRGKHFKNMSPGQFGQLKAKEEFNQTPLER